MEYTPVEENQDKKHEFFPMETTKTVDGYCKYDCNSFALFL